MTLNYLKNREITVMGLGLNGGGEAAARFLAEAGASVTVTDLGSTDKLKKTIDRLKDLSIRYVLGKHKMEDFINADIVIKNPAVSADSPFLKAAKRVETDISLFLRLTENPVIAVTGSKGKSTTVSALHHMMKTRYPDCRLGGNITVSPLTFFSRRLDPDTPVILELSSWQLADLENMELLKPCISVITNIMHDHQNKYNSFEDYIADKKSIFKYQDNKQFSILPYNEFGRECATETEAEALFFGRKEEGADPDFFLEKKEGFTRSGEKLVPAELLVPGEHFRMNILIAASAAFTFGIPAEDILSSAASFKGIEHRMEMFLNDKGRSFYNDTAATIPDASAAAIQSFESSLVLILGGTDKELDFSPLKNGVLALPRAVVLLEGNATEKITAIMEEEGIPWIGPFSSMQEAVFSAIELSRPGDSIVLSPGCASFGLFLNEFDRGNQFKEWSRKIVKEL